MLTDYFIQCQDATEIADTIAPIVAIVLHDRVYCYVSLPEQIYSGQGAQFEVVAVHAVEHEENAHNAIPSTGKWYSGEE